MPILKSAREKVILKQGLLVIGIMAGLYIFLVSPFLKEGSSILDEELERKTAEIKKYIARTGSMPSKESFSKMEEGKEALEKRFQELADFVDPEKVRISEGSSEAGLYFIERLHSSMKRFSGGTGAGATLPENLGFGDGLPKGNMVDALLRQLETVELTVDILLKGGKTQFTAIKPLKSIDYVEPLSKKILYTELPVQISIKTDTESLVGLLLELKNQSPAVSVKELHIKSGDIKTGNIEASLVLSAFRVSKATTYGTE